MMNANDKKIWKAAVRELLALGITDIHTDPELEKEFCYHGIFFAAQYGPTPVVVQYNKLHGLKGGETLVGFTAHGRCILQLTPQWTAADEEAPFVLTGLDSRFYLVPDRFDKQR